MGGSRATPIPTDAVTGFASASTLLRRAASFDEASSPSSVDGLKPSKINNLQSSGKVPRQYKERGSEKEKEPVFKLPRRLYEEPSDTCQEKLSHAPMVWPVDCVKSADILAPKKSRKKKTKDESEVQTTIKKTKITKPGVLKSGKKANGSMKKVKEVVSASTIPPASTQEEDQRAKEEFRDLCLEKAITRRREWTPCKDTAPNPTVSESFEKSVDSRLLLDTPLEKEPLKTRFGNLQGDFGFLEKEGSTSVMCETTRQGNGEAVMKRRKIELLNGVHAPRVSEKPKRCKSPKKKPQTVTEKATAPFAPVKPIAALSLSQFFEAPIANQVVPARGAEDNPNTPAALGRKISVKKAATSKPKTSKAKKLVQKQSILLSPESAVKNAKNQELIFGTSSQLARDESPAFLKDLQLAIKESELTVEQEQPQAKGYEFLDLPSGRSRSSTVRARTASKSLWSAASRDTDGSLVEVEIVNLADTPKPIPTIAERTRVPKIPDSPEPKLKGEARASSHAGEIVSDAPKFNLNDTADLQQQPKEADLVMPRSVAEAALRNRPRNKSPVKNPSAAKPTISQMPNYQGFTDIQLRKEVASYRFKPIKNRDAMIILLERCWKSKNSMALQELPANVNIPPPAAENADSETSRQASPPKKGERQPKGSNGVAATNDKGENAPPKKPRGRPKKDPTSMPPKRKRKTKSALSEAFVTSADDQIYDSNPPTPSPPKRRSPPKLPGQLQLTQPVETSSASNAVASKDQIRADLFSQITKAVTTYPPTHDAKNPTWYEKMLMYDPIILEDLTIWLNTEGLGKVGEDDEVSPGLVKEWCEQKSVCCLWRENLRGGARGRW